jgi:predicted nucleic acid-binding protein
VLDTNVLIPQILRDVVLRCASAGLYRAHWSTETVDELLRNLGPVGGVPPESALRLVNLMREHFEDAEVASWPARRLEALAVHEKDRHVLAAAITVRADVIVTGNSRHFADLEVSLRGISVQTADAFLGSLLQSRASDVLGVLRSMSARLKRPPMSPAEVALSLLHIAPQFANAVAARLADEGEALDR